MTATHRFVEPREDPFAFPPPAGFASWRAYCDWRRTLTDDPGFDAIERQSTYNDWCRDVREAGR